MSHIRLLIVTFILIFTQLTHSMNEENKPSTSKSRQLLCSQFYNPLPSTILNSNNNDDDIPNITITNSSSTLEYSSHSSSKTSSKNTNQTKTIHQIIDSSKKNNKHHNTSLPTIPISSITPDASPTSSPKSSPKKSSLKRSLANFPTLLTTSSHTINNSSLSEPKKLSRNNTIDSYSPRKTDRETAKILSKSDPSVDTISSQTKITTKNSISDTNNIIDIVRFKDFYTIKKYLSDYDGDLNHQNKLGMTALHYATLNATKSKNPHIIELLLLNPRTDSSLKNNNSQTASELIEGSDSLPEIRTMLFARRTLDKTVSQEMFIMLINLHIKKQTLADTCIKETIENIKNKIRKTESLQGDDRKLPQEAELPTYATDEFITNMLLHRIPKDKATQQLITVIHKEIHALLLNIEIDNTMIFHAVNTVKQEFIETNPQKNSHKKSKLLYLPHYADYEFIFNVIEHYIQKEKTSIKPSFSEMIPQTLTIQTSSNSKK